jgi:peptide/nickel transport system permease protein
MSTLTTRQLGADNAAGFIADEERTRATESRSAVSSRRVLVRAIARRLIGGVIVLWAAVTAAFFAVHLTPGNTVDVLIGEGTKSPAARAAITAEWGLDRPLLQQYVDYLGRLLRGDLGTSYVLQRPVSDVVFSQLGPTAQLAATGAVVAVILAVIVSVATAGRPIARRISGTIELITVSIPEFWLGLVLLSVFSFGLGWFPVAGADGFQSLVLPALALGLGLFGMFAQVLREGIERSLDEPYSLTVRSRGVSDLVLRLRHSVRHASLPVITLAGWTVGGLLGGAVIVEQVFGRPGVGQVALAAAQGKDLPVVLGVALVGAFAYVIVNTVVDIVALAIDPRLRVATGGGL